MKLLNSISSIMGYVLIGCTFGVVGLLLLGVMFFILFTLSLLGPILSVLAIVAGGIFSVSLICLSVSKMVSATKRGISNNRWSDYRPAIIPFSLGCLILSGVYIIIQLYM